MQRSRGGLLVAAKMSIKGGLIRVASRMPPRVLQVAEGIAQEAQGKGWGHCGYDVEVDSLDRVIRLKGFPPPRRVADVGAHVGKWTSEARKKWPSASVVAFEPHPLSAHEFRQSHATDPCVRLEATAIGATRRRSTLFVDPSNLQLNSLSPRRLDHFGQSLVAHEEVDIDTLDDYVERTGEGSFDLIKIDTEGGELDVLRGSEQCLQRVSAVEFEWGAGDASPNHWIDYWYFFSDLGFDLFRITPRGPLRVPTYSPRDEAMLWTNYIAVANRRPPGGSWMPASVS